jgi:hypothetical protein
MERNLIDTILLEWLWRIDDPTHPDLNNPTHLYHLREALIASDFDDELISEFIGNLTEKDVDKEKKDDTEDNEYEELMQKTIKDPDTGKEIKIKSAIEKDDSTAVYKAAEREIAKLKGSDSTTEFPDDVSDDDIISANGKSYRTDMMSKPEVDDLKKQAKIDDKETDPDLKKFSSKSVQKDKQLLDKIVQGTREKTNDPDMHKRSSVLSQSWNKFLDATDNKERVEALRTMSEHNLIARNAGSNKIYLNDLPVYYKEMTGSSGTAITKEMNALIEKSGLDVPMRGTSTDKALADMSGKHNESGVVAFLSPKDSSGYDEAMKLHSKNTKMLHKLGGDTHKSDEANKKLAETIQSSLPPGSTIVNAVNTGGLGTKKLMDLYGIDERVDPTDLLVEYLDDKGNKKQMKISAKAYTDPTKINMKNAGTKDVGETYLGDTSFDNEFKDVVAKNQWSEDGISKEEVSDRKLAVKKWFNQEFGKRVVSMTETTEGQEKLLETWRKVHGCGSGTYTSIVNKKSGATELRDPDYYCKPKMPFKARVEGSRLVIELGTGGKSFLELTLKTETKAKNPVLLFFNRQKK